MSSFSNNLKPRATKGFYGIMKGVVTRNVLHLPKPQIFDWMMKDNEKYEEFKDSVLNNLNMNKWEVQVWIPAYHGGKEPDPLKIGTGMDVGEYPWAQMCGPIFKDNIGKGEPYPNIWSDLFYGSYLEDVPSTYPGIGDVVWLMFENGDVNKPVVMGSLLCDKNKVKYDTNTMENPGNVNVASLAALEAVDAITLNGAQLTFPLAASVAYRVSSKFGWRGAVANYEDRNFHNGIDLAAAAGEPVVAAHEGMAKACFQSGGYGNYVMISGVLTGQSITTYYAHLQDYVNIGKGETKHVEAGDVIGVVGSTGNSTGPHLHFGLAVDGAENRYPDPVSGKVAVKPHIDPTGYLGLPV